MATIGTGYRPESGSQLRRVLEAKLNVHEIMKVPDGKYAVRYLQSRGKGLTKLANAHGTPKDVETLSRLSHADVRGLSPLKDFTPELAARNQHDVLPSRDFWDGYFLYTLAFEAAEMCGMLAETFSAAFAMPPWMAEEGMKASIFYAEAFDRVAMIEGK